MKLDWHGVYSFALADSLLLRRCLPLQLYMLLPPLPLSVFYELFFLTFNITLSLRCVRVSIAKEGTSAVRREAVGQSSARSASS
jgi:hypothetical protein